MTIFLRVVAMLIMKSQPVSDFYMAYDNAVKIVNGIIDPHYQVHYGTYPYWGFYSLTLALIFKIFAPSVLVGQAFNCMVGAFTTISIYFAAKKIMGSYKIGIMAAVLYMINPTIIIYNTVLSGEHLIMLSSCAVIYLLIDSNQIQRTKEDAKKIFFKYVWLGIFMGVIASYKPIHVIYLIALIIYEIIFYIFKYMKERKETRKVIIEIGLIFTIVISCKMVTALNQTILYNVMNINSDEAFRIHEGYGFPILAGLAIDENGNWAPKEAGVFKDNYTGAKEDFSKACFREVQNYIERYYDKYPIMFWQKFSTSWGRYGRYPESAFIAWSFYPTAIFDQGDAGQHPIIETYYAEVSTFLGQYYFLWMFFAFWGVISMLKGKINHGLFYCILVIFGFVLMGCFAEVQMRYRSILFPYISILSAVGMNDIIIKLSCLASGIKRLLTGIRNRTEKDGDLFQ